jgi:hypothetical protein
MYQLIATFDKKERFANSHQPKKKDNYQYNLDIINCKSVYRHGQ